MVVAGVPPLRPTAPLIRRLLVAASLVGCGATPEPAPEPPPYGDLDRPALRVTGSIAQWEAFLGAVDARLSDRSDALALAGVSGAWHRLRARLSDELDPDVWGVDPDVPLRLTVASTALDASRAALASGEAESGAGWRARLAFGVREAARLEGTERAQVRGRHGVVEWRAEGVDLAPPGEGASAPPTPTLVVDFAALAVLEAALGARDPRWLEVTTACVEAWTAVADVVPVARVVLRSGASLEAEIHLALTPAGRRRWRAIGPVGLRSLLAMQEAAGPLTRCNAGSEALAWLAMGATLPEYTEDASGTERAFLDLRVDPAELAEDIAASSAVLGADYAEKAAAVMGAVAHRFGRATLLGTLRDDGVTYRLRVGPPPVLESPRTAQ